jgi:tripartite-type tricarboxylate transporter receptor subunit TctC
MSLAAFLWSLAAFLVLPAAPPLTAAAATADTGIVSAWPSSDVVLTVPSSRGSEADALFALVREAFKEKTGKTLAARYVSGRAGADAWARMVDDPPDGSVLTVTAYPDLLLRGFQPDSGVSSGSMAVCGLVAYTPCVLWTMNLSAFGSVQAVTDAARGMNGNFPAAGPGRYSAGQVAARSLDRLMGVRTLYIPYAGSVEAAKAALNQQASVCWGYAVAPAVPGMALKPLAVAAETRLPSLPDVPTFRELNIDLVEGLYLGIAVPRETSEYTRMDIADFFAALNKDPAFQAKASALGFMLPHVGARDLPGFMDGQEEAARRKFEEFTLADQD